MGLTKETLDSSEFDKLRCDTSCLKIFGQTIQDTVKSSKSQIIVCSNELGNNFEGKVYKTTNWMRRRYVLRGNS